MWDEALSMIGGDWSLWQKALAVATAAGGPLVACAVLPLLVCKRIPERVAWSVIGVGALLFACRVGHWVLVAGGGWDFNVFHRAGMAIREARDPYADPMCQYPVTGVGVYALVSLLPLAEAKRVWLLVNVLCVGLIVWIAHAIVYRETRGALPATLVAVAIATSSATMWGLYAGQVSFWVCLWVYVSLLASDRGRFGLAGVAVAVASVKPGTALPLALQHLCKHRIGFWVGCLTAGAALALLCFRLADLPDMIANNWNNIRAFQGEGKLNDYSFAAKYSDDVISIERLLYCCGLRDRVVIRVAQLAVLMGLFCWLVFVVKRFHRSGDDGAIASLLCTFAVLVLYHRIYDLAVVAAPLMYCAGRCKRETGRRRALFGVAVVALLVALNWPRGGPLRELTAWSLNGGWQGRVVQAVVLPFPVWALLFTLFLIGTIGVSRTQRGCSNSGTVASSGRTRNNR